MNTGVNFAIFRGSGNIPVCMDKLKTYLSILRNSLKQFLITLKDISSAPVLLFIFREKKTSFNSFMVRHFSGKMVLAFFKKLSKGLLEVRIYLARNEPISEKTSLNLLAIYFSKVIYLLSTKSLRGSFDLLCRCILPVISFMTLQVFLLLLYCNICFDK